MFMAPSPEEIKNTVSVPRVPDGKSVSVVGTGESLEITTSKLSPRRPRRDTKEG